MVRGTLIDAGFLCEFDASHSTFISRVSDRNYVEAHHLIPLGCQEHFLNSLNVRANVVSLCPVCHRLLHHGKFPEKKVLLDHLFVVRQARLECSGIFTTAKELYS
ncbi:HNH endonuclease [Exiguobacterium sp. KJ 601]|uniref:HNH endonuclease n=1 Tax=Exiguobacterium sp. KJ 601 TaxID=2782569 RepID=UPI002F359CB7